MADFKEFIEQKTEMNVRFGSFTHHLDAESAEKYADTEYTLLVGLLLNATDECITERKTVVAETEKPVVPKKEKKDSFWKRINVGTLFDDPDEPTIK